MIDTRIKNIVIVGGGTAGWMTAAAMSKLLNGQFNIRLIESDEISTVGVGEATIPKIKLFNQALGLDENDFLRYTQGTFKLGIEFVNWGHIGEAYLHGFGDIGRDMGLVEFYHYWLRAHQSGNVPDLQAFSLNNVAAKRDKFMRAVDAGNSPLSRIANAFHFDAGLYAQYLRHFSETLGVVRTEGKIVDTLLRDGDGFIEAVVLANGEKVGGDLFIDCSGFRGLLIEQALKTGYEDWTHWLPCDRALAVPCEISGPPTPYTRATARSAGWQWRIPLQHRTGNGHVYCSGFMKDDEAARVLLEGLDTPALGDPRQLRFTTGRRREAWVKNVVALGLSGGFLEPLESTSIQLIIDGVGRLIQFFPDTDFKPQLAAEFNRRMAAQYESIRDFIILHYKITQRTDSEFWKHCAAMSIPDTLAHQIELFRATGRVTILDPAGFSESSHEAILLGLGVTPQTLDPFVDALDEKELRAHFARLRADIAHLVARTPDHGDFIAHHVRAAPEPALN